MENERRWRCPNPWRKCPKPRAMIAFGCLRFGSLANVEGLTLVTSQQSRSRRPVNAAGRGRLRAPQVSGWTIRRRISDSKSAHSRTPTALCLHSQGLADAEGLPLVTSTKDLNPERVASFPRAAVWHLSDAITLTNPETFPSGDTPLDWNPLANGARTGVTGE